MVSNSSCFPSPHSLSFSISLPFSLLCPIYVSVGSQVSLLCPPVRAGMESGCVSPPLVHYAWAWQIRRSAAERSEMLSYLHLPRYSSGLIISQARTRSRTKALSSITYDVRTPTAVTPILLQWQAKQDDYLKITHKWVFWKLAFQIHHSTISECKNMIKTRSLSALDLTIKL